MTACVARTLFGGGSSETGGNVQARQERTQRLLGGSLTDNDSLRSFCDEPRTCMYLQRTTVESRVRISNTFYNKRDDKQ